MAVSASNLTTGTDIDGNSTATTASITPTANRLILLTVTTRTGITANPNQPTATGNGLTWVAVNSVVWDTTSSSRKRVTVLRAMGASPSAGAVTIDFAGQNQTDVVWTIDELSGTDTSGTNGSGAIVQSATNIDETGANSTFTVTLAAFSSVNNATFGGMTLDTYITTAAGSGFTIIGEKDEGASALAVLSELNSGNDTTVDITNGGTSSYGGVAIEIKALTATGRIFRTPILSGLGGVGQKLFNPPLTGI
jgi:hypothetical protein